MNKLVITLALILAFPLSSIVVHAADNSEEISSIRQMQQNVLNLLYHAQPATRLDLKNAVGYAVFSSADVAALFVSASYGHGIAHDNKNSQDTFMQMASAGVGLGVGAKTFRAVFVFTTPKAFYDFTHTGLDLSGNVDAAAKQGTKGRSYSGAADVLPGVHVYQITDTGLEAQVMVKGTKYWNDTALNADVNSARGAIIATHYNQ